MVRPPRGPLTQYLRFESFNNCDTWEHIIIAESDSDIDDFEASDGVASIPIEEPIELKGALFVIGINCLLLNWTVSY